MLTKKLEYDVQVLFDGQLQVRKSTIIFEDEVELSRTYHRHVVDVGQDATNEPEIVRQIASVVHTPQRIAARKAFVEKNK
jgi:hypothetical protein